MRHRRHKLIPIFTTRATATVSVALVLIVLGLAALAGVVSREVSASVRRNIGFTVVLAEKCTASDIDAVTAKLRKHPGVRETVYSSAETILNKWQDIVGSDEDILQLAGVNPFLPELEVRVTPEYASADSIDAIAAPLGLMPQIHEVKAQAEVVDSVNSTLRNVSVVLLIIGVALLTVSFVLIFNTVRLTVYTRRFTIHTMRLVGATWGFIRRPFLVESLVNGAVAGVASAAVLGGFTAYVGTVDANFSEFLPFESVAAVLAGVVLLGIVISVAAAFFAITRCLKMSYDEMF